MFNRFRSMILGLTGAATLLGVSVASPGCTIGYLARQGAFQAELLLGRQPIDEAIAAGHFSPEQIERLKLIPEIKAFGVRIGLEADRNYETINPTWDRTIWNVSACDPVSFRPVRWWFPVVGSVPYLGFFREDDARARARQLEAQGYDVYVRTAGAYSTLGWFRDPVLPGMLEWSEYALADTLLHELAHATLWVPGSVQFNETFANFVGQEAAMRYLVDRYGEDGAPVREARQRLEDRERFRLLMHEVYHELDAIYRDAELDRADKLVRRNAVFASLPTRVARLGLHRQDAYVHAVRDGTWNNARLFQFRTYNRSPEWFARLLAEEAGDLRRFIDRVGVITRGARDPFRAIAEAVGEEMPEDPEA